MSRKMISTTIYLRPDQDARLKALNARTKVPVASIVRQAIDNLLDKHEPLPQPVDENEEGAQ